jgi:hypothetical protein
MQGGYEPDQEPGTRAALRGELANSSCVVIFFSFLGALNLRIVCSDLLTGLWDITLFADRSAWNGFGRVEKTSFAFILVSIQVFSLADVCT